MSRARANTAYIRKVPQGQHSQLKPELSAHVGWIFICMWVVYPIAVCFAYFSEFPWWANCEQHVMSYAVHCYAQIDCVLFMSFKKSFFFVTYRISNGTDLPWQQQTGISPRSVTLNIPSEIKNAFTKFLFCVFAFIVLLSLGIYQMQFWIFIYNYNPLPSLPFADSSFTQEHINKNFQSNFIWVTSKLPSYTVDH